MANKVHNINNLSEQAIECRTFSHRWVPRTATPHSMKRLKFDGYNVTLVCDRCGTLKHFMLSKRGEYYPATYTYADDYLMDHAATTKERQGIKLIAIQGYITTDNTVVSADFGA